MRYRGPLPYLALAVGIICLGFSGIFVAWANAPGAVTGFYRMSIAVAVFAIPFVRLASRPPGLPRAGVLLAAFSGLCFAGDLYFWNTGVLLSGAVNPTLMGNTAPLWVGLGALLLFKERLSAQFWAGLILAMAGAAVILAGDAAEGLQLSLGTLLGLVAGVFYGAYFLATQRGRAVLGALTFFWVSAVVSAAVLLLLAILLREPLTGYPRQTYLSFLALGLLTQVVGQFAFSFALGYLPATFVAPAALGQPVVTALLAGPLLGERVEALEIVGGLAVLGGIYIVHRSRSGARRTVELSRSAESASLSGRE
jgi:drug/metabolite transporter (DMT)-like permease